MKVRVKAARIRKGIKMAFFNSAITVLQTLVIALGAGLGVWGVVNLLEGYGNDTPPDYFNPREDTTEYGTGMKSQKHLLIRDAQSIMEPVDVFV
jgi:hypothetical protein